MGTEGFAAPEQYEGKVNASSDLYAFGKTLQALVGRNWLPVLWKVPGLALFLYKCIQPQEKRRLKSAAQARKMLSGIGKRKGHARKNIVVAVGTTGILLAAGVLLAGTERQVTFESALAEVTKGYYEIEENKSSSLSKEFVAEADKKSTDKSNVCSVLFQTICTSINNTLKIPFFKKFLCIIFTLFCSLFS